MKTCQTCKNFFKRRTIVEPLRSSSDQSADVTKTLLDCQSIESAKISAQTNELIRLMELNQMSWTELPVYVDHCRLGTFPNSPSRGTKAFVHKLKNPRNECSDWRYNKIYSAVCGLCKNKREPEPKKTPEQKISDYYSKQTKDQIAVTGRAVSVGPDALGAILPTLGRTITNNEQSKITASQSKSRQLAAEIFTVMTNDGAIEQVPEYFDWCYIWSELAYYGDKVKRHALCKIFNFDGKCVHYSSTKPSISSNKNSSPAGSIRDLASI